MISIKQVKPFTNNTYKNEARSKVYQGKKGLVDIVAAGTKEIWNRKVENTQMERFKNVLKDKYNVTFDSYWDFHEWSVQNYASFWEEVWHFYGVQHSKPYETVVKNGDTIVENEWFVGAELNYAENLLRYRDDHIALICVNEDGDEENVTYAELYEEVKLYAAAFKKNGLRMGDRVGCYMSNRKEAVFAMLAATSMGALWGGPLPFYGAKAVATIMNIMKPKFLIASDRFQFNKEESNLIDNLAEIVNNNESIKKVIIVPTKEQTLLRDITHINNSCFLDDFLATGRDRNDEVPDLKFEQLPFDYPAFINFTSGTTGLPKGLVHSAGTFLPLFRDFGLHCDLSRSDVILSMQPVGWNLWNLYVGNLALGASLLLFDGLPCFLSKTGFWDILEKYKVSFTFLVTSIVDTLEKENIIPNPNCNLDHLKIIAIGASPVKLQNIEFIRKIKPDVFVGCLYGATETIGVFSGFDLNTPAYSAEIQCVALGVDLRCFDSHGNSIIGKSGELVIATPTPSFPVGIWNDKNREKMHETYLAKFPGFWVQNDEGWFDPDTKGLVIIGRSDNTIKQHGERFVSEEIYWALHNMEEIADCVCVGQHNSNGDERAVLFVKMKNSYHFDKTFVRKVEDKIIQELTVFYVPGVTLEVKDIPYNLNGKKMEILVKKIVNTNKVPEVNNVRNPECLEYFCNLPQLQDL